MLKTLCICIGLSAAPLALASPMVAYPLAPSTQAKSLSTTTATASKPSTLRRIAPPKISVTEIVRQTDGSLSLQCVQRPNPLAKLPPSRTIVPYAGVN